MRRLVLFLYAWLLFASLVSPTTVFAAEHHKVSLKLQSESWREAENHKPYDLEPDLRSSLKASGIDIVDEMQEGKEARLLIAYKERKGESYGAIVNPGKTVDFGTVISLELTMISPVGKTLLEVQASCSTPFSVGGTSLYQAALDELKSEPLYKKVGLWVLAGLGSSEALRQLLPVVVDKRYRAPIIGLIEQLRFEATQPADRAWIALGREDYTTLAKLGTPAVDPLLAFLAKYHWPHDSAQAANALAEIGDPSAAKPVVDRALEVAHRHPRGNELLDAVSLFASAGRLGNAFSIAPLEGFLREVSNSKGTAFPQELSAAAVSALARIRERVAP